MKKFLILAALMSAPLAAHAEPAQSQRAVVSMAGLDLSNPADANVMIQRIQAAVRPICVAPGFANGRSTSGCIRQVTADAIRKLRVPELTVAFQRHTAPTGAVAQG